MTTHTAITADKVKNINLIYEDRLRKYEEARESIFEEKV